jgi:hypothetical protein
VSTFIVKKLKGKIYCKFFPELLLFDQNPSNCGQKLVLGAVTCRI